MGLAAPLLCIDTSIAALLFIDTSIATLLFIDTSIATYQVRLNHARNRSLVAPPLLRGKFGVRHYAGEVVGSFSLIINHY